MQQLIKVIDADFSYQDGPIEVVRVWHESFGQSMQLDEICGHDFFLRWMPAFAQTRYKTLSNYWFSVHPHVRDLHIAEYLLDRSNVLHYA